MKRVYYLVGLSLIGMSLVGCATGDKDSKNSSQSSTNISTEASTLNKKQKSYQSTNDQQTQSSNTTNNHQKTVASTTISKEDGDTEKQLTWSSMDEAIDFYEKVYKNTQNEVSKNIVWENYDRRAWSLAENNGDTIVLHWSNIGGAGGSYDKFIKINTTTTKLVHYDGNNSYPDQPTEILTVNNDDYKVISE
jgi:hypothetical protein